MQREGRNYLELNADHHAVRAVLGRLFPACDAHPLAELVLAEVLNNVVEHAYDGQGGRIILSLRRGRGWLSVRVADRGRPYPGGTLPDDILPEPDAEGGFGWGLIRALASGIAYRRAGEWNVLVFRVPLDNGAIAA